MDIIPPKIKPNSTLLTVLMLAKVAASQLLKAAVGGLIT